MEETNQFTCLTYDNIDFLIQSRYVLFGIYLHKFNPEKSVTFDTEVLPHIYIGQYLEETFLCKPLEECYVMLVMNKDIFDKRIQKLISDYTGTKFPKSGNFAISLNASISSRIIDVSLLKLLPKGIRPKETEGGITAISFQNTDNSSVQRKQLLLSPDYLLKKMIQTKRDGSNDE